MTFIANDRMSFDSSMKERFLMIVEYPSRGDMRSVRPSIRAMEIGLRGDPHEKDNDKKRKNTRLHQKRYGMSFTRAQIAFPYQC
jgi:hypothetical protein